MGLLAPLFLAGLAGLSVPLILHIVRRMPRGRQEFSSLMFLAPTPPRLTRRSRLDQVFLLCLRLAALSLLALAFARPFWREAALLSLNDLPRKRVALLIDTSASLRRGDLWNRALEQARTELDSLAPQDEVALFTFSDRVETLVPFPARDTFSAVSTASLVRQRLTDLQPTWAAGDLGMALRTIAEELTSDADMDQSTAEPQIVVISDFQKGTRLDALQGFEWPPKLQAVLRPVAPTKLTNASLHLLAADEAEPDALRVRVTNAGDSSGDQFFVRWTTASALSAAPVSATPTVAVPAATASAVPGETAVYVPPGQSRVVLLPRTEKNLDADRIVLRGDDHDFDNTYYVVPPRKQEFTLVYVGTDKADDPQGLRYYLQLACGGDPLRQVQIDAPAAVPVPALTSPLPPPLVVVTDTIASDGVTALQAYVERGGKLLLVPREKAAAELLPKLFPDLELPVAAASADSKPRTSSSSDYVLLGEIDFKHPLFVPFDNPRYNDFTRIHFWRHWPVAFKPGTTPSDAATRVAARFDNGDPWLLERTLGRGRIVGLTCGWSPDDSQLAVSSKFVPLIGSLLDQACGSTRPLAGVVVNQPVPLPAERQNKLTLRLPDREQVTLAADETLFRKSSQPGIYEATTGADALRFAVNLADAESDTAPLGTEPLDQLGVRLGTGVTRAQELARMRQERDTELESRQHLWRWLLVGCLSVLMLETWWSGRAARPLPQLNETVVETAA